MNTNKISINETKLGGLILPLTLFDSPKYGQVTSAVIKPKYDDNSKKAIPDTIAKVALEVVNYQTYQIIAKTGGSISDLATVPLELISDEATMKKYSAESLIGKILDLQETEVALRWVARNNSGSWGGFKLVCDNLKLVQPASGKATE